jgi:hypothetical protein
MNRRTQGAKTRTKAARAQKAVKHGARSVKSARQGREVGDLEKTLSLITKHPGIRPSVRPRIRTRRDSNAFAEITKRKPSSNCPPDRQRKSPA